MIEARWQPERMDIRLPNNNHEFDQVIWCPNEIIPKRFKMSAATSQCIQHSRFTISLLSVVAVFVAAFTVEAQTTPSTAIREGESRSDRGRQANRDTLILAHYMPWYTAKPDSDQWGWHWTMNHFDPNQHDGDRRQIASQYYPSIGPYDSGDKDVLEHHLLLMKLSGIDGVIVDWYGLSDYRDYPLLHRNTTRMLQACERLKMKFAICYEDQTITALVNGKELDATDRVTHAVREIEWLGKYWFKSPSYVRLENQPVMLSFGHDGLDPSEWQRCLSQLSFSLRYFSQDYRRPGASGGFGWPSPTHGTRHAKEFLERSADWPQLIPVAFPRFNDIYGAAGVRDGFPIIPDEDGETLRSTVRWALASTPEKAPIIQIATWNDWGEGTQIEPSLEHGTRDLRIIKGLLARTSSWPEESFKLPFTILRLRRATNANNEILDRAVQAISDGDLNAAKSILAKIESPSP